jgi:hypothetical protein
MLNLVELGELFLSWRLYVGLGITAILCWLVVLLTPNETVRLTVGIPIGVVGAILSFRWQIRADFGNR